jgi:hypothetical protein
LHDRETAKAPALIEQLRGLSVALAARLNRVLEARVAPTGGYFGFAYTPFALGFGELGDPTVGGRLYNLGDLI